MSKERRRERRRRNRRERRRRERTANRPERVDTSHLPHDRDTNGSVAPGTGLTHSGRREIILGYDYGGGKISLPPYVELEGGVQVHPSRLKDYLRRQAEIEKKTRGGS